MSRVGEKPIEIPTGVTVEEKDGLVKVKGPLGAQEKRLNESIQVKVSGNIISVIKNEKANESNRKLSAFHGLYRSLIANMVNGVSKGFEKELDIVGVGYRATQQNRDVVFQLGYSHNIVFTPPEGITVEVVDPVKIKVKGSDKQKVGQVAANIRKLRPPEPYKGKGIRYKDEYIRKKAGKAGKV